MQWLLVPGKPGDLPEVLELSEVQEPGLTYRPRTGDSAFGQILVLLVRLGVRVSSDHCGRRVLWRGR